MRAAALVSRTGDALHPLQPEAGDRWRYHVPAETTYRLSIRAKTCDILRGLLPAATTANVGIFGSAQGFESLLLHLQDHSLEEARTAGHRIVDELRGAAIIEVPDRAATVRHTEITSEMPTAPRTWCAPQHANGRATPSLTAQASRLNG